MPRLIRSDSASVPPPRSDLRRRRCELFLYDFVDFDLFFLLNSISLNFFFFNFLIYFVLIFSLSILNLFLSIFYSFLPFSYFRYQLLNLLLSIFFSSLLFFIFLFPLSVPNPFSINFQTFSFVRLFSLLLSSAPPFSVAKYTVSISILGEIVEAEMGSGRLCNV